MRAFLCAAKPTRLPRQIYRASENLDVFKLLWRAGTAGCQAEPLLEMLRCVSCDTLYLVGDIVDGWELSSGRVHWPQAHSDVIQKLLKKARKGTRVIYCPGNHDEALRDFIQDSTIELGANVTIQQEATHVTADGRRLLVLHGDRCDLTPHGAHARCYADARR